MIHKLQGMIPLHMNQEEKNLQTIIFGVKESITLSVCLICLTAIISGLAEQIGLYICFGTSIDGSQSIPLVILVNTLEHCRL